MLAELGSPIPNGLRSNTLSVDLLQMSQGINVPTHLFNWVTLHSSFETQQGTLRQKLLHPKPVQLNANTENQSNICSCNTSWNAQAQEVITPRVLSSYKRSGKIIQEQ